MSVAPDESWLEGVDELLDTLPPEQREAVQLRLLDDLAYDEVGLQLSITPQNARVRVHRALTALRTRHFASEEIR